MDHHAEMPYQGFEFDISPLYAEGVKWHAGGESWHVTAHITMPVPGEMPSKISFHRDHSIGGIEACSGLNELLATLFWGAAPSDGVPSSAGNR